MIKNRFKIPTHLMDDVAFGIMMHRAGVKFGTFPILNLDSVEHIQDKKINDFFQLIDAARKDVTKSDEFESVVQKVAASVKGS
jgi:hypothetical protein